jgi:cyclopropane fatty-acyl-phospholipid synthase-like methyltransferase
MQKPFSQACENNKSHILNILKGAFSTHSNVLEVGSGTGQHGVHFAKNLTHLTWQTSDLIENHQGINLCIDDEPSDNLKRPLALDFAKPWPVEIVDGIFTANTLHIVSEALVESFFKGVGRHLAKDGTLCIYGPFKYDGEFTSPSNGQFELWLKNIDPNRGIRDIESIISLAKKEGLLLINDFDMPANNQLLVFKKSV